MGLRETMSENSGVTIGIAAVVIVLALGYGLFASGLLGGSGRPDADTGDVFISEDYQTYRPGVRSERFELGPNGKPKAIAYVVKAKGEEPTVHYFERLAPEALEAIKKLPESNDVDTQIRRQQIELKGSQVRAPRGGEWVPAESPKGRKITTPPSNTGGDLVIVTPNS